MLIKVFGEWINPDKIVTLSYREAGSGYTLEPSYVHVNLSHDYVQFVGKTVDEVAAEINRQLKRGATMIEKDYEGCHCDACQKQHKLGQQLHWSSCAVHNEPAMPNGDCDCGVIKD